MEHFSAVVWIFFHITLHTFGLDDFVVTWYLASMKIIINENVLCIICTYHILYAVATFMRHSNFIEFIVVVSYGCECMYVSYAIICGGIISNQMVYFLFLIVKLAILFLVNQTLPLMEIPHSTLVGGQFRCLYLGYTDACIHISTEKLNFHETPIEFDENLLN